MRVLSGIQPSGSLHIGNYFGAIKRHIELQEEHECYFFIANYHALTSSSDPKLLEKNTLDVAITYLSLGLDPEKVALYKQSDVQEVVELSWILSTVTPMGLLERCHSYKDKIAKGIAPTHGLFAYPVLMAADILLPLAEMVPVGKDQKQHIEVTRDIAIKFNNTYGETFVLPEPNIPDQIANIPGVDGQKMSKSYDNYIDIFGEEKIIRKKVMAIVTDSTPVEEPKDPETCNVYNILKLFLDESEQLEWGNKYRSGGLGYGDVKKALFERAWEYFAPFRKKREELVNNIDSVQQILDKGAEKVKKIAIPVLEDVRRKVGIK